MRKVPFTAKFNEDGKNYTFTRYVFNDMYYSTKANSGRTDWLVSEDFLNENFTIIGDKSRLNKLKQRMRGK